jgi:adrenodoxin-NADP+ reductase
MVFAYGASEDRRLGIPGEDKLNGIYSARAFVGWYNGLPEYAHLAPDLESGEDATIIGQGNVALDVARTLLTDSNVLRQTDMAEYAVEALSRSKIKRVRVVGRRGPVQAAFTTKEVRELMNLPHVGFKPVQSFYIPSSDEAKSLPRTQKRIMQVLTKGSTHLFDEALKSWELDFLLSPTSFNSSSQSPSNLSSITFSRTEYATDSSPLSTTSKTEATETLTTIPTDLAFRSIGYKSSPLPGLSTLGIPFDTSRGIIPHDASGRAVLHSYNANNLGGDTLSPVPGIYCAGWVRSGPNGVIAHTMEDAFGTAEVIAQDWERGKPFLGGEKGEGKNRKAGWEGVLASLSTKQDLRRVSWRDWEKIDAAERRRGRESGKEREKFASVEEMLGVL